METIIDQIEGCFHAGFYYASISMALALPDICATLQLPSAARQSKGVNKRYVAWYDKYLAVHYPMIKGLDLFSLRNGVVHSGRLGHPQMRFSRIAFLMPNQHGTRNQLWVNDVLMLDAQTFCERMIAGVRKWEAEHQSDGNVARNRELLVQFHPDGFSPYVKGMPMIA